MLTKLSAFTLALALMGAPAFAMDCEKEFRVRIDRMMSKPDIRVPISDMVASTKFVVEGYDFCMKGDMDKAKTFFEKASKGSM